MLFERHRGSRTVSNRFTALTMGLVATCAVLACGTVAAQHYPAGAYQELNWRSVGPTRGGRTRAVAGVPSEPHVFYMGAVNGGVWKTDDAGRTWRPIFDDQPTQSIGAIAVAPSDPKVVYVGSGEGLYRPDVSLGNGVYRSEDAGRTWVHRGLGASQQIAQVVVDPRNADRLFVAALGHPYGPSSERGIFRSVDGGRNWERVLYQDENTGGADVAIDPVHPDVVYASLWEARLGPSEDHNEFNGTAGGLYKSTDGGTTWRKLSEGLPSNAAQVGIAIAPSLPSRLYLTVATTDPGDYASAAGLGLYRSDDAGEHWARATDDPRPALRIGGGDLAVVRVDPTNPDVLYSASIVTLKSTDGGKTWLSLRGAPGGDDYQNLWINPTDPKIIALVADQGALVTLNGGRTWSSWFNQSTAQLYHIGITPALPYRICSGQQDSGSVCVASRGNDGAITASDWHPVGVIEYGYVTPDPVDPDVIYGAGRNQVTRFHWSTGQTQNITPVPLRGADVRADRTEPLLFSPLDPHTMYYAANRLYRTSDGGNTWQPISPDLARATPGLAPSVGRLHPPEAEQQRGVIYSVAASAKSRDVLWAGTDDGLVWVTQNGGGDWSDVSPPGLTAWSKVTQIEASHTDPRVAYVSVSRMRIDDLRPYAYRTRDGGKTWSSISAGLPDDAPVNAVREDPTRPGLLYAATERAVWVSYDEGDHWDALQANLPHSSMRDLAIHDGDLIVATHGRGFWILDDISRLRQMAAVKAGAPFVVEPKPAHRMRRSTWSDTPIPPDEPSSANPPSGIAIDYFLPKDAKGPVMLEVLDTEGALVRRFVSDDPPSPTDQELARQLVPAYWAAPGRSLATQAGMHRWVWDFRYPAPVSVMRGYPISAVPHATPREPEGPLALPGNYRARLTVEGHHYDAALVLKADPRVRATPGELEAQYRLASTLASDLTDSSTALLAVRSVRSQAKSLVATGEIAAALGALEQRLAALVEVPAAEKGAAEPTLRLPAVQAHLVDVYGEVMRADAAPTSAQLATVAQQAVALKELLTDWRRVQSELPALNTRLRAAKLAPLRPELAPPVDRNAADED